MCCLYVCLTVAGLFLTVLKEQSMERGNKRVRIEEGSEACSFALEPAFKTYSSGDEVTSGRISSLSYNTPAQCTNTCPDFERTSKPGSQVVLRTFSRVGGQYMFLNMSCGTGEKFLCSSPLLCDYGRERSCGRERGVGGGGTVACSWTVTVCEREHSACVRNSS